MARETKGLNSARIYIYRATCKRANRFEQFLFFCDTLVCTSQSHKCSGRVMGFLLGMRERVNYDSRCLIDLIDVFGDAHILDCGWREADPGEWQLG